MQNNFYRGSPNQRGYGLGGSFRRFFSWIVPIFKTHALPVIKSGLKEVGKTAISTAADVAKDLTNGRELRETLVERVNNAVDEIKNKAEKSLAGGKLGIKRKKKNKKYYLIKKRSHLKDIFS